MTEPASWQPTKAEFDKAIDTLLGSAKGRELFVIMAGSLGLFDGHDMGKLAFLFFTDPDFARKVSDKVWTASQNREVSP